MILNVILGFLACLSLGLLLWQWIAARRFPLHQRVSDVSFAPAVTVFKPLKGADAEMEQCLRSWFTQHYVGLVQILFGVHSPDDPACAVVKKLLAEFPQHDVQLVITSADLGANGKVSNLAQLTKVAKHDVFVISDGDVRVPEDFLANAIAPLGWERPAGESFGSEVPNWPAGRQRSQVGLVNCFYRLANPTTLAMQWEAIAINADFWSQVLQSKTLKPLDFALGAVMVTRRKQLEEIGGFESLADCLADDYQLGNRIAKQGHRIELCPVVVECWHSPQTWRTVWKHQLRWARTVRVCQPAPYFFSILSNAGFWAVLWLVVALFSTKMTTTVSPASENGSVHVSFIEIATAAKTALLFCAVRILCAFDLQRRLTHSSNHAGYFWLVPVKDLMQFVIWLCAFAGNRIEWRGQQFQLRKDGTLVKLKP